MVSSTVSQSDSDVNSISDLAAGKRQDLGREARRVPKAAAASSTLLVSDDPRRSSAGFYVRVAVDEDYRLEGLLDTYQEAYWYSLCERYLSEDWCTGICIVNGDTGEILSGGV